MEEPIKMDRYGSKFHCSECGKESRLIVPPKAG